MFKMNVRVTATRCPVASVVKLRLRGPLLPTLQHKTEQDLAQPLLHKGHHGHGSEGNKVFHSILPWYAFETSFSRSFFSGLIWKSTPQQVNVLNMLLSLHPSVRRGMGAEGMIRAILNEFQTQERKNAPSRAVPIQIASCLTFPEASVQRLTRSVVWNKRDFRAYDVMIIDIVVYNVMFIDSMFIDVLLLDVMITDVCYYAVVVQRPEQRILDIRYTEL
uniref:Uncharacterized protein n=1 Tax=Sphaerodactylus townsendi TaxID=933632 RepID=A0ACB8FE72_9SAUR